jgi:hypothetical protein
MPCWFAVLRIAHRASWDAFTGLPAALCGIAPYAAINFAAYDITKKVVYEKLQVRCWGE